MSEQTTEEFLEHFGVKGMKWGSRKAEDSGGDKPMSDSEAMFRRFDKQSDDIANWEVGRPPKAPKGPKLKSADIIAARERNAIRYKKFQEAQGDFYVARTRKGQDKAEKIMRDLEKKAFDNEDTATAAKLTTGEKVGLGLLATYGAASIALIVVAGRTGI